MRRLFYLSLLTLTTVLNTTFASGDTQVVESAAEFIDQQDIQQLREWLSTKRQVSVKQIGGDLSISGEVRAEMQYSAETKAGVKQRGPSSANPNRPEVEYDIEVNLMLDYRNDRNWAAVKLEFDNNAGNNLNVFDSITLEKAYFGLRFVDADLWTLDTEIGRRNLGTVFDSKVQYGSFMDGILLKVDVATAYAGDFYLRAAPFLINEKRYQYGYVGEIGLLNAFSTGFYGKFSMIDWDTKDFSDETLQKLYRFLNAQVTLGYKFNFPYIKKSATLYGAYINNLKAKADPLTNGRKEDNAWYAGLSVGRLRQPGDWAFDVNYQYVQAQAISQIDAAGIGRGNASRIGFYTENLDGTGNVNNIASVVGKTNYKGAAVELLYLYNNTLTIYQSYRIARNAKGDIGPKLKYQQYELELIYSF